MATLTVTSISELTAAHLGSDASMTDLERFQSACRVFSDALLAAECAGDARESVAMEHVWNDGDCIGTGTPEFDHTLVEALSDCLHGLLAERGDGAAAQAAP